MFYFCKQYDLQVKWNYWRWKKTYRKQNPLKNAFLGERPFDHLQRCVKYGILPVKFPGENMIYMCQRLSRGLRVSDHFSNFSSFIINSATLSRCLNSIDLANSCQRNHSLLLDKQTRQKFVLSACTCALSQLDFWDKSAKTAYPSNPVFLYFEANRHSIILFL